jgi:hypothetical protein
MRMAYENPLLPYKGRKSVAEFVTSVWLTFKSIFFSVSTRVYMDSEQFIIRFHPQ